VNGDGVPDIITGPGAGGGPDVRAFSGVNGAMIDDFFAYEGTFTGGVRVGVADLNGDGRYDVRTTPGPGRAAEVRAFDGVTQHQPGERDHAQQGHPVGPQGRQVDRLERPAERRRRVVREGAAPPRAARQQRPAADAVSPFLLVLRVARRTAHLRLPSVRAGPP